MVEYLDIAREQFRRDGFRFRQLIPPPKYSEPHIIMTSAINDIYEATTAFSTFYALNLSQGTPSLDLANHASELLNRGNEDFQRAGIMFAQLES